jgi:glycosyltransferase involved in cell wall biosynthesis
MSVPPPPTAYRPLPTRTVAIGGLPYFGRRLATLLDGHDWQATYLETRRWEPRAAVRALRQAAAADLVYLIGGQIERFSRPHLLRLALRRPIVMHWTGSDVLFARRVFAASRAAAGLIHGVTHWAGAPWLAKELRSLGVQARWLPHSWVEAPTVLPPLPPGPLTVLAYLPEARAAFYGGETILRVATALPEVRVLVVGARSLPWPVPANVCLLGWVGDMAPVYARSHVLLRLPRHDGLAFMVQEALAYGRYAVWTYPFPDTIQAYTPEAALAAVRDLCERHAAGELALNAAGAARVRGRFSAERIRADLLAGFEDVLGR